jgi:hypothetical protein
MVQIMEEKGQPFVQFEIRAVENRAKSKNAGRYVADDVDFVIITPPGGNLVVDREVTEELLNDPGKKYLRPIYEAWKKNEEIPVKGTPIKTWAAISPAEVKTLLHHNLRTVEELAETIESAIHRLGTGGFALKNKAKAWLDTIDTGKTAAELESLRLHVANLKDQLQEKTKAIDAMKTDNESAFISEIDRLKVEVKRLEESAGDADLENKLAEAIELITSQEQEINEMKVELDQHRADKKKRGERTAKRKAASAKKKGKK